ncbi:MAG: aspartate-semialdehyde dehydrogenase [Candidatus Fischerbacteria bacterium RBG_13_37_8]|uniref:Aspartate-semialdehyde dehydrogenase n=1 Tax=Candidatus Fischerbacteria bacterium RBG_13_37_8 TaxID=1817863 RepID=A0A1F5VYD4_9BACT|nr:MAG: aspartate-semialdehyde dehydrogenase [Candidatus Fischerbacteria bacterium RBG_13_37_8]
MKKIKVAVMGCTGLVGQQFIRMLEKHPYFDIELITASPQSAGFKYGDVVDWIVGGETPGKIIDMIIADTAIESFRAKGIKVVFSALPAAIAKDIEGLLVEDGYCIFTNASSYRMLPDVPIVIPEVNSEHFRLVEHQLKKHSGFIVTNSNCTTAGLVVFLKPLMSFGIRSVMVTTYQALSGAGRHGVASMDIIGNIIPFIRNEEEKMENETRKIMGMLFNGSIAPCEMEVNASCCRVAVRDGHLESVSIELSEEVDLGTLLDALKSFRGVPQELRLPTAPEVPVIVRMEEDRPQPLLDVYNGNPERARGMAVTAGRIRKKGNRVNCFILSHNTIRGAAGTCILNAELALQKGYLKN